MVTPTRDQIRERALELYMDRQLKAGLPAIMPTDAELKEENLLVEAKLELMRGAKPPPFLSYIRENHLSYYIYISSDKETTPQEKGPPWEHRFSLARYAAVC